MGIMSEFRWHNSDMIPRKPLENTKEIRRGFKRESLPSRGENLLSPMLFHKPRTVGGIKQPCRSHGGDGQGTSRPSFTFIDLFAGIGGFRMGLEAAGGKCVFSSERNQAAADTYRRNFGESPHGDITQEAVKACIPLQFDLLSAGFPCQPFSISGKMRGFEDTRGTLIYEVFKIMERHKPPVVLLENVKHLRYHDKGRTLRVILSTLKALGYTASWAVLNARSFGVPQNRERVIIVAAKKWFDFLPLLGDAEKLKLRDFLDAEGEFDYLEESYTLLDTITAQPSGLQFAGYRNKNIRKVGIRAETLHLSRVHKQPNRIYSSEGVHPALPSQETSGRFWILHEGRVRKLTLPECYRIMGFPEGFLRHPSQSEQYRQIGNSVCVPMVTRIAEEIVKQGLLDASSSSCEPRGTTYRKSSKGECVHST